MTENLNGLILLPRLRIENANAVSGPLTWGFPAPTAFTGFAHALSRRIAADGVQLDGVGIVCHRFDPQVSKPNGYQYRFNLARHPMGKDGKPPGTVEEGRAHLEVSLIIGVSGYLDEREGETFAKKLHQLALGMRLAGGSIRPSPGVSRYKPTYLALSGTMEGDEKAFRKYRRRLLPGFALMSRHDLLREHLEEMRETQPDASSLDALLELVRLNLDPSESEKGEVTWRSSRTRPGWLVPLPIGYGAISELFDPGIVKNTRDSETPFRFVESLCSLGEWVSPHRLSSPQELLWRHRADPEAGLYIVEQNKPHA
ncbi:MAG: type I-F CRISPR-associated protein Csy2 [Candidatus Nitrospinota bacterium M3_3B_026]